MDTENEWHFGHVSWGRMVFYMWVEERKGISEDQIKNIQCSQIPMDSSTFSSLTALYLDLPFFLSRKCEVNGNDGNLGVWFLLYSNLVFFISCAEQVIQGVTWELQGRGDTTLILQSRFLNFGVEESCLMNMRLLFNLEISYHIVKPQKCHHILLLYESSVHLDYCNF